MSIKWFSLIFMTAVAAGLFLTPVFIRLAIQFRILDNPGHRKTHQKPVAYLGGASVFTALIFTLGLFWFFGFFPAAFNDSQIEKTFYVFGTSLGICLVGLWDDIFNISPRYKFVGQLFFAGIFVIFGYRFNVFQIPGFQPMDLGILAIPLTLFWLLAVINAVNMIDGLDGLASTVIAGTLFLIGVTSAMLDNEGTLILSLTAMGSVLGFLVYNWSPARIYLGDAGSNGLGMLLAGSLVALGQTNSMFPKLPDHPPVMGQPFPYQFFGVTLLIFYPTLEILLSVTRRLFRGRPISRADKGHIHHRLVNLGWSKQGICLAALVVTFLGGCVPIAILSHQYGKAVWLLATLAVFLGVVLSLLGFLDFFYPHVLARSRPHYLIANHFVQMQRLKLKMAGSLEEILTLLNQTCVEFGVMEFKISVKFQGPDKSPCEYFWERSPEVTQEYLDYVKTDIVKGNFEHFKEKISLRDGDCNAFWMFEPHTEERDLDVEYRVLISEFMRETLEYIHALKVDKNLDPQFRTQGLAHAKVRSSFLSRRQAKPKSKTTPLAR